jgi:hypothetical protein
VHCTEPSCSNSRTCLLAKGLFSALPLSPVASTPAGHRRHVGNRRSTLVAPFNLNLSPYKSASIVIVINVSQQLCPSRRIVGDTVTTEKCECSVVVVDASAIYGAVVARSGSATIITNRNFDAPVPVPLVVVQTDGLLSAEADIGEVKLRPRGQFGPLRGCRQGCGRTVRSGTVGTL